MVGEHGRLVRYVFIITPRFPGEKPISSIEVIQAPSQKKVPRV